MGTKPKTQKKKTKKLKTLAIPKRPITESSCRDEVIWELYQELRKIKKGRKIKIYLQNVDFPIDIKYKKNFLDELKRKKVIKNYKLEVEKGETHSTSLEWTNEPNLELLPLISFKEFKNAPRTYSTQYHSESYHMAIIECNPEKLLKYFEKDFVRIKEKIEKIEKRKEFEDFFKKEQVLVCNELRFGIKSGNIIYEEKLDNFSPKDKGCLLLKALMEKQNEWLEYEEISNLLYGTNRWKSGVKNSNIKLDINSLIKNIKNKLGILGSDPKNKELFFCRNRYMMRCDPKE
jgi:hypothetical protein